MLGKVLYSYRTYSNISEEEIANFLKIPVETYNAYESGTQMPNEGRVKEIARFYGVTVDDLYCLEQKLTLFSPDFEKLETKNFSEDSIRYPELSWEEKELVYNFRRLYQKEAIVSQIADQADHDTPVNFDD